MQWAETETEGAETENAVEGGNDGVGGDKEEWAEAEKM